MSIVEKAIRRSEGERSKVSSAVSPVAVMPESGRGTSAPLAVANPAPMSLREHLAFEAFPALARDFRFLKRPVLARVFGQPQSESRPGNVVMITSDLPRAGKSFVSLNLAGSLAAERMMRVLLVDADPMRHSLSTQFGVSEQPGLLELLSGDVDRLSDVLRATDVESLYFLPAGLPQPDATELLASPRMGQLLKALEDPDLVVLLDSPPLLLTSEGRVLAEHAHHALVVVEAGRSTASEVSHALEVLKGLTIGVSMVLNKSPAPPAARHEEYYYA